MDSSVELLIIYTYYLYYVHPETLRWFHQP